MVVSANIFIDMVRPGGIPVLGDFNNDGQTDRALFRDGHLIADFNKYGDSDAQYTYARPESYHSSATSTPIGITDRAVFPKGTWIIDFGMDRSVDFRRSLGWPGMFR